MTAAAPDSDEVGHTRTNKCHLCNTGWSDGAPDIHAPNCQLARDGHTTGSGNTMTPDQFAADPYGGQPDPGITDHSAIADRLRKLQPGFDGCVSGHRLALEAADAIESLAALLLRERERADHAEMGLALCNSEGTYIHNSLLTLTSSPSG